MIEIYFYVNLISVVAWYQISAHVQSFVDLSELHRTYWKNINKFISQKFMHYMCAHFFVVEWPLSFDFF